MAARDILIIRALWLVFGILLGTFIGRDLERRSSPAFDAGRFQGWRDCVRASR